MKREFSKKLKLPNKPGVYFFLNKKKILYIGKATSLRSRVRSYFSREILAMRGPLVTQMVGEANKIDWMPTDSVLEALILEASLIKKHKPYYNTKEKDDKSFLCVVVTDETWPRVFAVRSRVLKEHSNILKNVRMSKIYGPFTSGPQLREAMKIIRRIFPYLDDKSKDYLEFYRQINLAPDLGDRKLYINNIRNIKLFFAGKKKEIIKNLKKEMKEYGKRRQFEKAGEIKRQLFALQHINDVALLKNDRSVDFPSASRIEAYDIAHMSGKNMVGVMVVVENNEAVKAEYRMFKIRTQANTNDTGALKEVLERRFNHAEWKFPDL